MKAAPCDWDGTAQRCSLLQMKAVHSRSWGKGGHIAVYPVSEYQCRAKAMLKCFSIVFVSSFVRLTNEVHGDTGWERRSRRQRMLWLQAPEQVHQSRANICTAVSVANKWPPSPHHHHRHCLKERGQQSPHKWLRYGHINPGADTVTYLCPPIPISLPENPLAARQLLRCILATCDIAEVKP